MMGHLYADTVVTVWFTLWQNTYFCFLHLAESLQTMAPSLGLFGKWILPFENVAGIFLFLSFDVPCVVLVLLLASWIQVPYRLALGTGWVVFPMMLVWMFSEAEDRLLILAWSLSVEQNEENPLKTLSNNTTTLILLYLLPNTNTGILLILPQKFIHFIQNSSWEKTLSKANKTGHEIIHRRNNPNI